MDWDSKNNNHRLRQAQQAAPAWAEALEGQYSASALEYQQQQMLQQQVLQKHSHQLQQQQPRYNNLCPPGRRLDEEGDEEEDKNDEEEQQRERPARESSARKRSRSSSKASSNNNNNNKKRALPRSAAAAAASSDRDGSEGEMMEEGGEAPVEQTANSNNNTQKTNKYSATNHIVYKGGPSTFGKKENPLQTQNGHIDGRSNAQACFEQFVYLLRDYKQEHGTLHIPPFPTAPRQQKYRRLYAFLQKQRKFYRKQSKLGVKTPLTPERIQLLTRIVGADWVPAKAGGDTFPGLVAQLKTFYQQYGHTCVQAVVTVTSDTDTTGNNNNTGHNHHDTTSEYEELLKFVRYQRINFGLWEKKLQEQHHPEQQGQEATATEADVDEQQQEDPWEGAGKNNEDDNSDGSSNDDDKKKKRRNKEVKPAAYYTQEMHDQLKSFHCPYVESSFDHIKNRTKTLHSYGSMCTSQWFVQVEKLRDYRRAHRNEFIANWNRNGNKWAPLETWAKKQRMIYRTFLQEQKEQQNENNDDSYNDNNNTNEDSGVVREPVHPMVHQVFKMLQDDPFNLVLDPEKVKEAEAEVRRKHYEGKQKVEEERKRKETPQYKLEIAKEQEADAKDKVEQAKVRVREAQAVVKEAERMLKGEKAKVAQAQKIVDDAKHVDVKSRGGNRSSGRAKVLKVSKQKLLNGATELTFYDVEYLETGEIELFVDGLFVIPVEPAATAPTESEDMSPRAAHNKKKGTRPMRTRGRANVVEKATKQDIENARLLV